MSGPIEQRWTKPSVYDVQPGHWKRQLPGKHLIVAARGKVAELEPLLAANPDFLNRRGNHGRTLLWEACRKGRLEAVEYLLSKGADPNLTGCYNSESHVQLDCYCAARFYCKPDAAERILPHGADTDIFRACFLGDLERIDKLLVSNPNLINEEDPHDEIYRMPPIAFALAGGHLPVALQLIDAGATIAGYSSLLIFMIGLLDRSEFIHPLIAAGLDMRATDSSTFVASKSLSCLAALLTHGAPIDRPGHAGFPPLVYLCRPDKGMSLAKIELLISRGADVNVLGPRGATPLHFAVRGRRTEVVSLLLRNGSDSRLKDEDGNTPLDIATESGNHEFVSLLQS